ncbi:MAG TPA: RND transporter, partial [Candidatus Tenderia electrophaga]|nr:RND transporter [Candidatus Tenderia electrophaga]
MTERFAKWVTTHPVIVLIVAIFCIGLFASGAKLLSFSNDYRLFFSEENPQLRAFEELQNTYTKSNNVVIVIAPRDKDVFTRDSLKVIEELTASAWQTPYSTRVDSITNFQHTYAEGDDLIVENLVENAEDLSDEELESIRKIALGEPALVNKLISPQGHVAGINVAVYLPEHESHQATPQVMNFIRDFIATAQQQHPEIEFHLTGIVALNNALQEYTEADLKTLVPATFIIVVLGLALLLRSTSATINIVLVVMFSSAAAMGLAGWLGIVLTPSSIGAPTIIATLAIADCVHILTSFLFFYSNNKNKQAAIIESLRLNFTPVLLTSLTTAIGLLSLNFSDAPPLRDLGNIAAIGVIAAFFLSVTLLPALMMIMPLRARRERQTDPLMESFANFVINHRNHLLWGMALLILALTAAIPNNQINDEFHKFFGEDTDIRQATNFADENLTGIYEIHYSLAANGPGGISDPEYLKVLEDFSNWYNKQTNVIHVQSILSIMKRLNMNLHYDDPAWYRIPEQRELSAQYLLLYEMS